MCIIYIGAVLGLLLFGVTVAMSMIIIGKFIRTYTFNVYNIQ